MHETPIINAINFLQQIAIFLCNDFEQTCILLAESIMVDYHITPVCPPLPAVRDGR